MRLIPWYSRLAYGAGLLCCLLTGCSSTPARQSLTQSFTPPTKAQTCVARAAEHYAAGQPREAWELLQRARRLDPRETSGLELAIAVTRDLSQPAAHLLAVREFGAAEPGRATTQHRVGLELIRLGAPEDGLKHLEAAVVLAPRTAAYARDLAAAYYAQGLPLVAADVLRQSQARLPRDATLQQALAQLAPRDSRQRLRHWADATQAAEPAASDPATTEPVYVVEDEDAAAVEPTGPNVTGDAIQLVTFIETLLPPTAIPRKGTSTSPAAEIPPATPPLELTTDGEDIQFVPVAVSPVASTTPVSPAPEPAVGYAESLVPRHLRPIRIIPLPQFTGPLIRPQSHTIPAGYLAPVRDLDAPLTVPIAREGSVILKITPRPQ